MIKKATIVILLCLAFPSLLIGQGETSNWYFGNGAGITFNNDGSVTATNDGKLNTFEGSASISDTAGNLLFYTDGITVYNQDHQIMENGGGLYGDPSSTQSAIIVPKPQNIHVFYIFTVDTKIAENDPDRGLNYSVVDMSLNNGKGKVVQKNIALLSDCSEKVTAVIKDCSEQSIWVITLASSNGRTGPFNTYHAFEVNSKGVTTTAVESTIQKLAIEDPRGYLKVSVDGMKLASANARAGLFLYDFDSKTGIVSNQKKIQLNGVAQAPYGIEFSPNGRFLYVHASNNILSESGHISTLLQIDLEADDVEGSQEILDTNPIFRGALQLGSNGKIYRTIAKNYFVGTSFLGVINNPNFEGTAAKYQHKAINLGGSKATQGLPPFIQSFFNKIELITDSEGNKTSSSTICSGESFKLEAEEIANATYSWEKDGVPFTNPNNNTFAIVTTSIADAGRYQLKITLNNPLECPIVGEALIEVSELPATSNVILTQCDLELTNPSDGFAVFNLNQLIGNEEFSMFFYESTWDRDNGNAIVNPNSYSNTTAFSQTLFYSAVNESGCEGFGELLLQVSPTTLNESILSPIMSCDENADEAILESTFDLEKIAKNGYENLDLAFYSNLEDLAIEVNPLTGKFTTGDTTIYVRLEKDNQCLGVERIDFSVNRIPDFEFSDTYEICTDGPVLKLEGPPGFDSYSWYKLDEVQVRKIADSRNFTISEGGRYAIEVGASYEKDGQKITCTTSKDFVVTPSNKAIFQEIKIEDISDNNTIEIKVSGDGDYEYSLNGIEYQDSNNFKNVEAGFYTVFVSDKKGCGISEETISVIGFPKFFTPNGDGFNDLWRLIGFDQNNARVNISIFNRLGKLMAQFNSNEPGWDGTFQGKNLPATDYWFKVAFVDGKEFNGHFSLKR